ncbi:unnamed protein product [Litomosoides sigmodontis]|uniref:Protein HGH1 N-terminal domain-containing protein n=1 Tax=Litomosoides sigmodontis TaxID=42156 RepID=A0A3P6U260_LITSI|nr:unnamed protein product [Litomosoides sigmodontis]
MKQHEISPEVITDLIQFLSPNVHHNLRQQALDYIIGLSASDQFNVIFQANDFLLGQSLCQLICEDNANGNDILPTLINATATDVICVKYVISNMELIQRLIEYCRVGDEQRSLNAGKILSNLSLHFPDRLYDVLVKEWDDFIADIIKRLNDSVFYDSTKYLGYVLINLTSIASIRCLLCQKFVQQMLPLMDYNKRPERCLIVIDILRNMCFENSCHSVLLDENDELLSTLLKPLADVSDNLDDGEIEKLPIQLQYYEGHRCQDSLITNKIIESLYQVSIFLVPKLWIVHGGREYLSVFCDILLSSSLGMLLLHRYYLLVLCAVLTLNDRAKAKTTMPVILTFSIDKLFN